MGCRHSGQRGGGDGRLWALLEPILLVAFGLDLLLLLHDGSSFGSRRNRAVFEREWVRARTDDGRVLSQRGRVGVTDRPTTSVTCPFYPQYLSQRRNRQLRARNGK
jgi:hypothetical protein